MQYRRSAHHISRVSAPLFPEEEDLIQDSAHNKRRPVGGGNKVFTARAILSGSRHVGKMTT